jgi:1,4-dihydroxy-2-naphthoyl-CoA hydrolase
MPAIDPQEIKRRFAGTFAELIGIEFLETTPERVVAEVAMRSDLTTVGGAMHGGAIMAFADTLGAVGAVMNLPAGASTTTLESKTNFFRGCSGGKVRAECVALHRGRRTSVWQTRLTDEKGGLLAQVIQTQMVLLPG